MGLRHAANSPVLLFALLKQLLHTYRASKNTPLLQLPFRFMHFHSQNKEFPTESSAFQKTQAGVLQAQPLNVELPV